MAVTSRELQSPRQVDQRSANHNIAVRMTVSKAHHLECPEATDSGVRTGLGEVISGFGFDRAEPEAELRHDLAAGRE
jgi:hypothetical protein